MYKKAVPDVGSYVAMSTICCLFHQAVTNIFPIIFLRLYKQTNSVLILVSFGRHIYVHTTTFLHPSCSWFLPDCCTISSTECFFFFFNYLSKNDKFIFFLRVCHSDEGDILCPPPLGGWVGQIPVLLTALSTTEENTSQPQTNCLFVLISHKHPEFKYLTK